MVMKTCMGSVIWDRIQIKGDQAVVAGREAAPDDITQTDHRGDRDGLRGRGVIVRRDITSRSLCRASSAVAQSSETSKILIHP